MNLIHRLHLLRIAVTSGLWFVPGVCVLAGIGLAVGLTGLDVYIGSDWIAKQSRVFGVGAEGSRGMLSSIAGSMMTVASLTFSLTISTLATASSQYTSRLIRNFMRDRVNQFVLGYFVGLFGYCLVVLRSIRSGDEGAFVPSLAVFGGLVLALVSIGVLVYFIHHIAESIQASTILDRVTKETVEAIDHLFPAKAAEPAGDHADTPDAAEDARTQWHAVTADKIGYVQSVDTAALVRIAEKHDTVVRMEADIGAFVSTHGVLCALAGVEKPDDETADELRSAFSVGSARTIEQDPAFGVRQVVDIALKALSPGINDTTTGVMCVQHLGAILEALVRRDIPDRFRAKDGTLRLIARGRTFEAVVRLALDQIRDSADGNVAVMVAMLRMLANTARQADTPARRVVLHRQARLVAERAAASLHYDDDRDTVRPLLAAAVRETSPLDLLLPLQWLPRKQEKTA